MSLCQPSDGILETHVSWDEFEERLTQALGTNAKFGPNKRAVDIGEGHGLTSRCALIECDWQGEQKDELPNRVVLKMPSCLALKKRMSDISVTFWQRIEKKIRNAHNVECYAYDLLELFGGSQPVPRRFYARRFDDENPLAGQICMEYAEGAQMMDVCAAAPLAQMKELARALGKVQAESTKIEVDEDALLTTAAFAENGKAKETFECKFARLKELEPSLIQAIEKVEAVLGAYQGTTLPSTIHAQLGMRPVLVHADMWTANVLVDKETGRLRMLIDWQASLLCVSQKFAHLGVGVEDLLKLSFYAQSTSDRRSTCDELVTTMYGAFVENLNNAPAPFTLEQLKEAYCILFPHCALFFVAALDLILRPNKPQSGDEEEKRRRYNARGVLEDIMHYHEMNKNSDKHHVNWHAV